MKNRFLILLCLLGLMCMGFYVGFGSKSLLSKDKYGIDTIQPHVLFLSPEQIKAFRQLKGTLTTDQKLHINFSLKPELKSVVLTKEDWEALEKITKKGISKIAVVNYETSSNFLKYTQYTHRRAKISQSQLEVLQKILEKY